MNKENSKELSPKILVSCYLASLLEMYDFAIFAFLGTVIHKNYLSFMDKEQAMFVSYVFFGVGYVFRPLGSLIFGYVGDVFGRKKSLVTSVSIMGFASLTMFLLPPFEYIGITACYVIVAVRVLQGISVGGEFTGAIVFAVEHSKKKYAGLVASIVPAGASSGILLANYVTTILNNPDFPDYSWRFAFLLGFVLALLGYFIRKRLSDTPEFISIRKSKVPLFEGLKTHKMEAFTTLCVSAASGAIVYFGGVYLFSLLQLVNPGENFNFVSLLINGIVVLFLPIFGYASDQIPRKYFVVISTLLTGVYILNCLNPILRANDMNLLVIGIVIYAVLNASMTAAINIYVVEIFPVQFRMSCSGLFYSLGMGLVGGTVPIVGATLMQQNPTYGIMHISYYLSFVCMIGACSIGLLKVRDDFLLNK